MSATFDTASSLPYLEQAAGYLGVVTTEKTWVSDRNILEVGKPEDVQRQELSVAGDAYLGTDMTHRGGLDDDALPNLFLQFLYSTVNQRYQTLAVTLGVFVDVGLNAAAGRCVDGLFADAEKRFSYRNILLVGNGRQSRMRK